MDFGDEQEKAQTSLVAPASEKKAAHYSKKNMGGLVRQRVEDKSIKNGA
jgi:hypothetical protein